MSAVKRDYSIFDKFEFEYKPVGIKYLLNKPEGIERLDRSLAMCEMFREAQQRSPFYADKDNHACVSSLVLGMQDPEPIYKSGQIGEKEKIYQEARANARVYQYIPKLDRGVVRYLAFSAVDSLPFEPDVMVFTATPVQAEILMRALSFSTGKPLTSRITPVILCAWLFVYPYVSGEMNYAVTGLGYGMGIKQLFPEGMVLISVPYDMLPMLMENIHEMEWVLPIRMLNQEQRKEYSVRIMSEIKREYQDG